MYSRIVTILPVCDYSGRGVGDGVGGFEAVAGSITATRTSYHSATVKDAGRPHSQNVGATQKG